MATTTLPKLKKKLDKVFSLWVRLSHADHNGNVRCYTCDSIKPWKQMDAGHFQSRKHLATRWDPDNVKPQCKRCNIFNSGESYVFGKLLDLRVQEGKAEELYYKAKRTVKLMRADYEEKIEYYNNKVKALLTNDS